MPKVVPDYKKQAMETIIDSASSLFFELGYSNTSMDEIAGRIGVTKGTLYLYFKSKEEILLQVCNRNMKLLQDTIKDAASDNLPDMAAKFFESEMKLPDHIKFHWIFALGEMNCNPEIRKILSGSYVEYVNLLADKIEKFKIAGRMSEKTDSKRLAHILIALHNGLMMGIMQGIPEDQALSLFKDGIMNILNNLS